MPYTTKVITTVGDTGAPVQVAVDTQRFTQIQASAAGFAHLVTADGMVQGRDSGEALSFLVSQLAYTEGQVYQRQYQPMQYEQLIPLDYSAGEWADTIRYEIMDFVGQGERTSGRGDDYPTVDVAYADKSMPVLLGAIGYEFTQEELRRTAYLRRSLPQTKPQAAIEGFKRHMNRIGLYGDVNDELTGLFNNEFVPVISAPSGGNWASQSASQILNDINTIIETVWQNTAYNDMVTDIVLPPRLMSIAASTQAARYEGGFSDKTILQYIKENNIAKTERGTDINFHPGYGLNEAGIGGLGRIVAYVKRDDRVKMHIPMPVRFLAPQPVGLSVKVPGEYKYSGVEFRYPKSAVYADLPV